MATLAGGDRTAEYEERAPHRVAWTEWAVSGLNGLFGDLLRDRQNGLAVEMAFYQEGRPLPLAEGLGHVRRPLGSKVCLLVHGLGCNEGLWTFRDAERPGKDTSYGALLEADLGYTPFYVRYNTGLSIAENGKSLVSLVDALAAAYPVPIDDIVLIGHSMGGLVLRSACYYGLEHAAGWIERVRRVFYLGTPHEGADLEKIASAVTAVLHRVPNPITRLLGDLVDLRSRGVKDLRFGTLVEPDADDNGPDGTSARRRRSVAWLAHAEHYLIGGTLTDDPEHAAARLFGDGLVGTTPTREGRQKTAGSACAPPAENMKIFPRAHHFELARSRQVYEQIRVWCETAESG